MIRLQVQLLPTNRKHAATDPSASISLETGGGCRTELTSSREAASTVTCSDCGLPPGGPRGAGVNEKVKVLGRCGGSQSLVGRGVGTACWTY